MATIGNFNAEDVAEYIDYTSKVLTFAEECGRDNWLVVQLSPRKAALVSGESTSLVPSYETILARKECYQDPVYYR